MTIQEIRSHRSSTRTIWRLTLVCLSLSAEITAQTNYQPPPNPFINATPQERAAISLARLKTGEFNDLYVAYIAQAHAVEATLVLEQLFPSRTDRNEKIKIASALVSFGDKNDTYWDYLVQQATTALEDPPPLSPPPDAQGQEQPEPSPAFLAWTKAHNVSDEDAVFDYPIPISFLAHTGDRRAIPLLRRALMAPNFLMQSEAAAGLASLQDKASIPLIIAACKTDPKYSGVIAKSLIYFDVPEAQRAVDLYLTKDAAKMLREARAQGVDALGLAPSQR